MRFPNENVDTEVVQPYIRSLNPGSQWRAYLAGEDMEWEVDCNLGREATFLNTVKVVAIMFDKLPQYANKASMFYIPELESPLFYSLRAAAKWAAEYEIEEAA